MDPSGWGGDKGYVGRGMITPHKKPPNGEPGKAAKEEKEENKSVNRIRQVVERTIAHIKSWRIHPHRLQETPGNIRADDHRSTRTLYLQNHPLNNRSRNGGSGVRIDAVLSAGRSGCGVGVARTGPHRPASPRALTHHHADPGQPGGHIGELSDDPLPYLLSSWTNYRRLARNTAYGDDMAQSNNLYQRIAKPDIANDNCHPLSPNPLK